MKLYIGPKIWRTDLRDGSFAAYADPAWSIDSYDLRSLVQCGRPAAPMDCLMLGPDTLPPGNEDYQPLGSLPTDRLDGSAKARLNVQASTLRDALIERLIDSADDTNSAAGAVPRCFPATPNRRGELRLPFGMGELPLDRNASWWPTVRRALNAILDAAPAAVRDKALSVMLTRNLKVLPTRENAGLWLERDATPAKPRTTLTDDFNRTAGDLNGSAASGGGTWAETEGAAWITNGTQAVGSGALDQSARLESDLSSADHYCQTSIVSISGTEGFGPACRFNPAAANTFYYLYCGPNASKWELYKQVSNSHTQIGADGSFTWSLPDLARLAVSGTGDAFAEIFINGVSQGTRNDTAIVGYTRCGVYAFSAQSQTLDDWEAGDEVGGVVEEAAIIISHELAVAPAAEAGAVATVNLASEWLASFIDEAAALADFGLSIHLAMMLEAGLDSAVAVALALSQGVTTSGEQAILGSVALEIEQGLEAGGRTDVEAEIDLPLTQAALTVAEAAATGAMNLATSLALIAAAQAIERAGISLAHAVSITVTAPDEVAIITPDDRKIIVRAKVRVVQVPEAPRKVIVRYKGRRA